MDHRDALQVLADHRGNRIVITTMAAVGTWPQFSDTGLDFAFMPSSMGQAPALGLGLALARSDVRAVIFDGDGNLLMNLGILPMVGALKPRNFVHVVFDNEVYGSTGNQASLSREVRLDRLAAAAGYRTSRAATTATEIGLAMRAALAEPGPHFILLKVTAHEEPAPRIPYPPEAIRDRFRASLGAS